MNWAVLVVTAAGELTYLVEGSGPQVARFTKREAKKKAEFLKIGCEGDEDIQSINYVKYPKGRQ